MIRTLFFSMVVLFFLTGCLFIGKRQYLSSDPIQFYDVMTGKEIHEVLILPRYSKNGTAYLAEPFVYHNGEKFIFRVPVSLGVIFATTYVGQKKSVDGFVVFAKGYTARWGGYGEEIKESNLRNNLSSSIRKVGLHQSSDCDSQCIKWLLTVVDEKEIYLDDRHRELFDFSINYTIKNKMSSGNIILIKDWIHKLDE